MVNPIEYDSALRENYILIKSTHLLIFASETKFCILIFDMGQNNKLTEN